jgi:hypothetical protein
MVASLDESAMPDHHERVPMTTPDREGGKGAWGAVARLLGVQLMAVVAVTAIITGIYALTGPHHNGRVTAGGSTPGNTTPATAPATSPAGAPPASPTPSSAAPATSQPPPAGAQRLKVDVLNQSATGGTAARTADRIRALGWTVGRVADFRGNVSETSVYFPRGEEKAARELAAALPGRQRVLPRFSSIAARRLTVIVTR